MPSNVSFNGFKEEVATFRAGASVTPGKTVKLSANKTVVNCDAGDKICGVAQHIRGGYVAVQLSGYCKVPYTGTAPALGYQTLVSDGTGVKTGAGREYLILDVNATTKTVGFIL